MSMIQSSVFLVVIALMGTPFELGPEKNVGVPNPSSGRPKLVGQDIMTNSISGYGTKAQSCDHLLFLNKLMCSQRNFNNITSVKCECEPDSLVTNTWSCIATTICQD